MADEDRQSRPTFQSSSALEVPAFFSTDQNAAELEAWKREHPDWFIAGWWTPARNSAQPGSLISPPPASSRPAQPAASSIESGTSLPSASAAAPPLSVAEFLAIGKATRSAPAAGTLNDPQSAPGTAGDRDAAGTVSAGTPTQPLIETGL